MVGLFVGCCMVVGCSCFFLVLLLCFFFRCQVFVLICFGLFLFVLFCFVLLNSIFEDIEDWIMHFQEATPWIFFTQHVFFVPMF